jgi:hypothetical protein
MISARRFGERQQPSGCWRGYARNLSGWISAYPRAVPKGLPMLFWLEIVRFGRLKLLREKSEQRLRIMAWDDVVRAFGVSIVAGRHPDHGKLRFDSLQLPNRLSKRRIIQLGVNDGYIDVWKATQKFYTYILRVCGQDVVMGRF